MFQLSLGNYQNLSDHNCCLHYLIYSTNNYNFTPSPSSDSHCESPTSNYAAVLPQMSSHTVGLWSQVMPQEVLNN